ncbi:hypothetical protein EYR38_010659 [Pleurotus pulmonarius]|nr:hypothetical protein EYR38_010659 [Pleurotus pulmonarius]
MSGNSRFSSFKGFKLAASSSSPSLVASLSDTLPPPPPPKDSSYSSKKRNKQPSRRDDESVPSTPISINTQFASYSTLISTGDTGRRPSTSSRHGQDSDSDFQSNQQTSRTIGYLNPSPNPYSRSNVSLNNPSASAVSLVSQVSSNNQGTGGDTLRPGEAARGKVKAVASASAFLRGIMGKRSPSPNPSVAASSSGENDGGAYLNPNGNAQSSSAQSVRSLKSMKSMGAVKGSGGKGKLKSLFGSGSSRSTGRDRSGSEASSRTGVYESDGDDGISTPWNFQHNIHVDEGLAGLPPSWSTQLKAAGFSDEEIVMIIERRRLQQQQMGAYVYSNNPQPKPPPLNPITSATGTVLIQPNPRSTSLRNVSNGSTNPGHSRLGSAVTNASTASLSNSIASSRSRGTSDDQSSATHPYTYDYPMPPLPPPLNHNASSSQHSRPPSPPLSLPDLPPPQPLHISTSTQPSPSSPYPPPSSRLPPTPSSQGPQNEKPLYSAPITPPRRPTPNLYVMNGVGSPGSPPPAYMPPINGTGFGYNRDEKEKEQDQSAGVTRSRSQRDTIMQGKPSDISSATSGYSADGDALGSASDNSPQLQSAREEDDFFDANGVSLSSDVSVTPTSRAKRRSKRFSRTMPPRLSLTLKDDGGGDDLSLWSEAVFSAIPSTADEEEFGKKAMIGSRDASGASRGGKDTSGLDSSTVPAKCSSTRSTRSGSNASTYSDDKVEEGYRRISHWEREQDRILRELPSPTPPLLAVRKTSSMVPAPRAATSVSPTSSKPSPIPSVSPGSFLSPGDPTRSVLFDEIMSVVNPSSRSPQLADEEPALSETTSPTLPISPENARLSAIKFKVNMFGADSSDNGTKVENASRLSNLLEAEDEDATDNRLSTLTVGDDSYDDRRDANRDSSMSTISSATVTNATIVRSASYATRAVANVEVIAPRIDSPPSSSGSTRSLSPATGDGINLPPVTGAGKRGELTLAPAALISGSVPSPTYLSPVSPGAADAYGGLAPSPPESSGVQAHLDQPIPHPVERDTLQIASSEVKQYPASPQSSHFGSEESSWSGTGSSSSISREQPTPISEIESEPTILAHHKSYSDKLLPLTDPMKEVIGFGPASLHSTKGATGLSRTLTTSSISPLSPYQRYRGWQHEVVKPLEEFIDEAVDPRDYYLDLQEIAEGESGSVYSARLASSDKIHKLKLPPLTKARDAEERGTNKPTLVAIKNIPILPGGSPKLVDLRRELKLMKGLWNSNILGMDAVYVDLVEDSLWIRMELMERSLADVVALVPNGLVLVDRMIARFANDILLALDYLRKHRIAHRDVRSDNLLLNSHGILKLADFTHAIQVSSEYSECSDNVGVLYWQAPEIRTGPYDPLKVDVWSLGATVWEMAEAEPPFSANQQFASRWPPLTNSNNFSPSFHDFLRLCSEPAATRPDASDLMKKSFLQNVCGRPVIQQLLASCTQIEADMPVDDEP